jgi:hypothetical protein
MVALVYYIIKQKQKNKKKTIMASLLNTSSAETEKQLKVIFEKVPNSSLLFCIGICTAVQQLKPTSKCQISFFLHFFGEVLRR